MALDKKIFLITSSLKHGGSERVISELANYFSKNGYNTHLVIINDTPDFYKINKNVKIHRMGFVNKGLASALYARLNMFIKLRRLMKQNQPDAVLSFIAKFNLFTLVSAAFLNFNIYISDRSNPKAELPFYYKVLKKILYPYSKGIIAQTTLAEECIHKLTAHKNISVIPNPIRKVELYPLVNREKIIINVGRLVAEKGQGYLLDSFSKLGLPDWKLVILGDGPMRQQLIQKSYELGIDKQLVMPGAVSDVDAWLAKSSVFAFTSISEGFPNALIEAMAAGLPCVSFDCEAGPSDIIESGKNGYLVQTGNVDEFTNSLRFVVDNLANIDYLKMNALDIRKGLDISYVGERYLNFILPSTKY